jgi:hypothetical protein
MSYRFRKELEKEAGELPGGGDEREKRKGTE